MDIGSAASKVLNDSRRSFGRHGFLRLFVREYCFIRGDKTASWFRRRRIMYIDRTKEIRTRCLVSVMSCGIQNVGLLHKIFFNNS